MEIAFFMVSTTLSPTRGASLKRRRLQLPVQVFFKDFTRKQWNPLSGQVAFVVLHDQRNLEDAFVEGGQVVLKIL